MGSRGLLFVFLVFLISCSVEGSSYCMADCDSNGQRPFTKYEALCCSPSNKGDIIHVTKDNGRTGIVICPDTIPKWCPFSSCYDIQQSNFTAPSGYYNILSNGSQVEVYCDMEGSHCDEEGGWTRVAFVNMSVPGSSCPPGLVQYDNIFNTSLCWINNNYVGCNSAFFSTYGLNYTKVCGRVRGYQYGYPYAFTCNINNYNWFNSEIKTYGVTLTYGNNPRKHTWTYAGGYQEQGTYSTNCPCNNGSQYMNYTIPFVGNDYYCESGTNTFVYNRFIPNDPLWDGQDCPGREATCCASPKMPWFIKTLNETTNDDIELNVCGSFRYNDFTASGGTPFDLVEFYIK